MEKHNSADAVQTLKKAIDACALYKKEGDDMFKRLQAQEKELRRLYAECMQQIKADKEKEKKRAKAMFGGSDTTSDSEKKALEPNTAPAIAAIESNKEQSSPKSAIAVPDSPDKHLKKKVSFADGKSPGDEDDDPSFFEEHMEALVLVAGIGLGCWLASMAWKRR